MFRLTSTCLLGLLAFSVFAQTVDQTLSIEDYVNEVLLGEGVTACLLYTSDAADE